VYLQHPEGLMTLHSHTSALPCPTAAVPVTQPVTFCVSYYVIYYCHDILAMSLSINTIECKWVLEQSCHLARLSVSWSDQWGLCGVVV